MEVQSLAPTTQTFEFFSLPNPQLYPSLCLSKQITPDKANLVRPPLVALQRLPLRLQRNRRSVRPHRQPTHPDQPRQP